MDSKSKIKYLLIKKFSGPARRRVVGGLEPEANKWLLSNFVLEKLVPIVGVEPYPVDELLFFTSVLCYFRPQVIFDWGTHVGKSARIFYEISKEFRLAAEIHTTDLPENTHHKEFPGQSLGNLIRNLEHVHQHRGDGVSESLAVYAKLKKSTTAIFFLDGDHSFQSVKNELAKIGSSVSQPIIMIHDTFYQNPSAHYNLGPHLAVDEFLEKNPQRFAAISTPLGLPGITLLYPRSLKTAKNLDPKVTVLMPVYNGARFLREAIESVLNQTYDNFKFLIIDDGSTDESPEIIRSYHDPRIVLVQNNKNMGIIYSLNKGLNLVKTKYVARMDADDISLPHRLEKQIDFLEKNPQVGVCGTWTMIFDRVRHYTASFPERSADIKAKLLFENVIQHPTAVIRTALLRKYRLKYSLDYPHVEDYGLWANLVKLTDFANIGEVLLHYRLHPNQVGQVHGDIQLTSVRRVHELEIKNLGLRPTKNEPEIYEKICYGRYDPKTSFVDEAENWLLKIQAANNKRKIYDETALAKVLGQHWLSLCFGCISLRGWIWQKFWASKFSKTSGITYSQTVKFWLATIFSPIVGPIMREVKSSWFRRLAKQILLR